MEDLLPYTVKGTEERLMRRQEQGLRVKGTGVGQKVKGKLWERTQKGRLEKRRQAMLGMPKLVQTWKQVSFAMVSLGFVGRAVTDWVLDGSRTWLEEMAKMKFFNEQIIWQFASLSGRVFIECDLYQHSEHGVRSL